MSTAPTLAPSTTRRPSLTVLRRPRRPGASASALPRTVTADLGVPTVHRTVVEHADLDHAATTPALQAVADAVAAASRTYGSVHRGVGYPSYVTTDWFEQARAELARFVGARDGDEVVFTRNTTDALRLLAHCLPAGTRVLTFASAHHAALLPWPAAATTRLPVPCGGAHAGRLLAGALASEPSPGPRLVVLTGACHVTGEVWPVPELARLAHSHGARVVVDAAQLAPHRPVDLRALGADWVAFSGHKLYAPYGAGALVGRRDWLDRADPYLPAGGATAQVGDGFIRWHRGPARHEGGTPNALGAIGLAAAAATLAAHRAPIRAQEEAVWQRLRDGLAAVPGVRVARALQDATQNVGVVTFTVSGYDADLVSTVLADEHGISVRAGRFCAHLLCDHLFGADGCAVRASIGLDTTIEHADRLVQAVRLLVERGPAFPYHRDGAGRWVCSVDPRDLREKRPW